MEIEQYLPEGSKLLFLGIVGSQSYGLATEHSDVDRKAIFMQSNEDLLRNKYVPQIEIDKDFVAYELRRFLELLTVGNPNVLELLFLPTHCIESSSLEFNYLKQHRESFLTKKCYDTFSGYARTQLNKASGINKKFKWEEARITRKQPIDFAKFLDRQSGETLPLTEWLKVSEYTSNQVGLVALDGFRDGYKLFIDQLKWASDNHRFDVDFETRGYKGFGDGDQPTTSEIEKYMMSQWLGFVYWNREAYSTHCKEYREYSKWLKNRNENRVATNKAHGQQYDSKNLLHLVRLIMTAEEIPTQKTLNVDRSGDRDYLLSIRRGDADLKEVIDVWTKRVESLKSLYEQSDLPDSVDIEEIENIELRLRK